MRTAAGALAAVALSLCLSLAARAARTRALRAEDLPQHTYALSGTPRELLESEETFAALATALRRDLEKDLQDFDLADRSVARAMHRTLAELALLEGRRADAGAELDRAAALEDKPALRATAGLLARALALAGPASDRGRGFRRALDRALAALDFAAVREALVGLRADAANWSLARLQAEVATSVAAEIKSGRVPLEAAAALVHLRFEASLLVPVRAQIRQALAALFAAHEGALADLWPAREVSLDGEAGLAPVVIAIWDTGVDVSLFPGRLFVNAHPGTRRKPSDGWRGDLHGIAYGADNERTSELLRPMTRQRAELMAQLLRGYGDERAGVDSPDAQMLQATVDSLSAEEMTTYFDAVVLAFQRAHGTAVADVAARGNPAARILVARAELDAQAFPEPRLPNARRQGELHAAAIAYFKKHGARVVNLSWTLSPHEFKQALIDGDVPGTPAEQTALARDLWSAVTRPLCEAIAGAPGILFVVAAGNENTDARAEEEVPASLSLPNLITVGAANEAGDEATFSNGGAQLWAKGVGVLARMPGGEQMRMSGTSIAAPAVTGLAAKLLALNPSLTPVQLKALLLQSADERKLSGGRVLRLLNPRRAVEQLKAGNSTTQAR